MMIWDGLRDCYRKMTEDVKNKYGVAVTEAWCHRIFRAMMHGYMAFDKAGEASGSVPHLEKYHHRQRHAEELTKLFAYPYSAALEHRASVSGDFKRGSACTG